MKIVISILILLLFVSPVSAWWNTDYANRREIQINNTLGSELTYYQVYINLTSNPINSTSLKIVNESSETIVPHWQETIVDNNCTELWFNATFLNANSWINETYYIYYNNLNASISSNGTNTFMFFDDFNNLNKWTVSGSPSVSNGVLTIPSGTGITSTIGFTEQIIIKADLKNSYGIVFGLSESTITVSSWAASEWFGNIYFRDADSLVYGLDIDGWGNNIYTIGTDGTAYHKFNAFYGIYLSYYKDDIYKGIGDVSATINIEYLSIMNYGNGGTTGYAKIIFVRKYTAIEPFLTYGAEETMFIPPIPTNLSYSRGFFWVNHTWDAGTGNVTDFYNVFHNGIWTNDSSNTYYNSGNIGDEGYSEILIYAYNNSGDGTLSDGYITQNISAPPYTPPPTPVNLNYTKGLYWVNHTWDAGSGVDTDSYNVSHNGTWANGSTNTYFNSGDVGRNGISTIIVYAYNGILSEGYITQTISTQQGIDYERKMSDNDIKSFYYPFMGIFFIFLLLGVVRYIASR